MLTLVLILSSFTLLLISNLRRTKSLRNLPPGPNPLPIIGNLLDLAKNKKEAFFEKCQDMSKTYGPILYLKLGELDSVVFEDCEHIKVLGSSDIWVDKMFNEWIAERSFGKALGVVFIGGDVHKEMRRFTVRTLRDFGFGKQKSMESTIQEELQELTDSLQERIDSKNGIIDMKQFFTISVLNILWSMVASTRFSHEDPRLHNLLTLLRKSTQANAIGSVNPILIYSAIPFVAKIPFLFLKQNAERKEVSKEFCTFFKNAIEERRALGEYKMDQRDFIDVFLQTIDSNQNMSPEKNYYTDEQLAIVIMDLFMAGSESTSNTMEYAILYLILYPEVQAKLQAEIDSVIGTKLPEMTDYKNMPYTQAMILELQRMSNTLPIVRRSPTQDTNFEGYHIPKGTVGMFNLYSVHMNEKTWKNPHEFQPSRFLDSENNIINSEKILPFGFGKRRCIGESLVKATIFTFITTLLQKFSFELCSAHERPTTKPEVGFTLSPKPYYALVKERHGTAVLKHLS